MTAAVVVPSATLGRVPGATGSGTQSHFVWAANTGRWWFFTWHASAVLSGTASSGSTTTLVASGFTSGALVGFTLFLTGGAGAGQVVEIASNTTTTLTFVQTLTTAVDGTTTYEVIDARRVHAWVSSSADLSTATWSEVTPGSALTTANPPAAGIDLTGGKNDPGGDGCFPVDGRSLAVGYGSISGVDVLMLFLQTQSHWMHSLTRARLGIGAPDAISWDTVGVWTGIPGNECPPSFPQALSAPVLSSTNRWHAVETQNFAEIVGTPATVIDDGTANRNPTWGGTRTRFDDFITWAPWQSALAPLASGFMLAVYTDGAYTGPISATSIAQAGLRWAESASESAWAITTVGAAVPNLSTGVNDPNDWGLTALSLTDIHVVRRNSATVLEQVRYSGHGGSWGAKVTLPSTGLTGHLAGSGVALVDDGTTVWCFVIDTDANHSIRYLTWQLGTGWSSNWAALSTDANVKDNITATWSPNGIAVGWTKGSAAPFEVDVGWLPLQLAAPAQSLAFWDSH